MMDHTLALIISVMVLSVKAQDNSHIRNITFSVGEDIFIEWRNTDPVHVTWAKDGLNVAGTTAASEERVFTIPEQGLLILNSKLEDRGYYTALVVTSQHDVEERVFLVNVAPSEEDVDNSTDGGFPCGHPRSRGKIIGGKIMKQGQSPWTVLLWDSARDSPYCGGVLLNRRWVVTAAQCFGQEGRFSSNHTDGLEIRLGEYDTHVTDGRELFVQVEQIIVHPRYDERTYDSDIALIKLRQPITYTDDIVPVCMPSDTRAAQLTQAGKQGSATGWGTTSTHGAGYSRYLRKVKLSVVDQQDCGNAHQYVVTSNMFCAASDSADADSLEKDVCRGDSGGPFVIKDGPRWYLVGLVSWGIGCGNPQFPGVYTRVQHFKQWIDDLTNEEDLIEKEMRIKQLEKQLREKEAELQTMSQACQVITTAAQTSTAESPHIQTFVTPVPSLSVPTCGRGLGPMGTRTTAMGRRLKRLVGGNNAPNNAWPWMVGIYYWPVPHATPQFICGGSLITSEWVLTAAHCFRPYEHRNPVAYDAADLIVAVGTNELIANAGQVLGIDVVDNLQVLPVADNGIITHDDFDMTMGADDYDFDVALLRLDNGGAELTSAVGTICLPEQNDVADLTRKGAGSQPLPYVTGWGSTDPSGHQRPSDFLQQLAMPLKGSTTCRRSLEGIGLDLQGYFTENMFCAGFTRGEQTATGDEVRYTGEFSSCKADTGDPMVRQKSSGDTWYQIGIVSWGIGCAQRGQYEYYTDVTRFVGWIKNKTMIG